MVDMIKRWTREMTRRVGVPLSTFFILIIISQTTLLAQPEVVSTSPERNELNVPVSALIGVTFDRDMDWGTINENTFIVNASSTGRHPPMMILHIAEETRVVFTPETPFEEGEVVTVVLTSGIEDEDNNPLDPPYIWSFTVGVDDGSAIFAPHQVRTVGDQPYSLFAVDLDGENQLDLAVVNYNDDDVSVLLSDGLGGYDRQDYPVGDGPYSVVAADLDSDGDLDLATANYIGDNVSVLFNNGDGTLVLDDDYPTGNGPTCLFAADLNGDGYLDLVTANRWSNNVSVLLNNGDGTFAGHVDYPVDINTWSVYAADLDGDGDVDLAATSLNSRIVSILLNAGDGTFPPPYSDYPVGVSPYSVFAADLNSDGDLDLAIANNGGSDVSVLLSDGLGGYDRQDYSTGSRPHSIFAADLDGDGHLDLATANDLSDNVSVLLNNGDGTFDPHVDYPVGDAPYSVFAADLDGDGELDLATANYGNDTVSVLMNMHSPQVLFTSPARNELNVETNTSISVEFDVDMDGGTISESTFIVNARSGGLVSGTVSYDNGTRTATFDPVDDFDVGEVITVTLTDTIETAEDIPLRNGYLWSFTVAVDRETDDFAPYPQVLTVGNNAYSVFVADLDGGDDLLDLAAATSSWPLYYVAVLYNNGAGFDPFVPYVVDDYPRSVFAADLNRDGYLDLITANSVSNTVSVLLWNEGTGVYDHTPYPVGGTNPLSVFAADFDGDGDFDLATANFSSADISVLLNDGSGHFPDPPVVYEATWNPPNSIFAADLDGDGDIDLATTNPANEGPGDIEVLFNRGDATFVPDGLYGVFEAPSSVVAADLDGDGHLDLATEAYIGQTYYVEVYLNNGHGRFIEHTEYEVDGSSGSLFAADLDGDGDLDLVTTNNVPDPDDDFVTVLPNAGDGTFPPPYSVYPVGDGPRSVFAADLDGDGDVDLATANYGSNDVSVLLNMHRPQIVATSPTQNELNVPVNTTISVEFDVDMDAATINNATFLVNARSTGLVSGTVSYDFGTRTATFDPADDFDAGEVLTVTLTNEIADDLSLDAYLWSFTVAVDRETDEFAPHQVHPVGDRPYSLFAADLDGGDGDLDLAAATSFGLSHNVAVLYYNGVGYDPFVPYDVDDSPRSVFAADLNRDDDYLDLITANSGPGNVSVLLWNEVVPPGDYDRADYPVGGTEPQSVFAADLDGDGDLDLATVDYGTNNVSVQFNNGDGTFVLDDTYGVGNGPRSLFAADLDGDGDLDLAVASCEAGFSLVTVLLNNGDGTFVDDDFYIVAFAGSHLSVFAADLDGDGDLDLATAISGNDNITVLLNDGDGTFPPPYSVYPVGADPLSVFAADLDGDGDLDLATAISETGNDNITVLSNDGNGDFPPPYSVYPVGVDPQSVFAADLDGDGVVDLATANYGSNDVSVLLNFLRGDVNEDGAINSADIVFLINHLYVPGSPAPEPWEAGDANCDGIIDSADVVYLINYLFVPGSPPPGC